VNQVFGFADALWGLTGIGMSQSLRESGLWFQIWRRANTRREIHGRNPFVNQVFGFQNHQKAETVEEFLSRNPFVNQVFGFICNKCGAIQDDLDVAIPS